MLVSYAGPFGTYESISLIQRLGFWSVVVGIAIAGGVGVRVLLQRYLIDRSYFTASVLASALAALCLALPVIVIARRLTSADNMYIPQYHEVSLTIFVIGLSVAALRPLVTLDDSADVLLDDVQTERPRLLERVPAGEQGDVVRLQVWDHYVSLVTTKGTSKLLMRFGDAIKELDSLEGIQVHRSHWVAKAHVVGHHRANNRLFLHTSDGEKIPVSRSFKADVENTLL